MNDFVILKNFIGHRTFWPDKKTIFVVTIKCKFVWLYSMACLLGILQIKYSFDYYQPSPAKLAARRRALNNVKWRPEPLEVVNVSIFRNIGGQF